MAQRRPHLQTCRECLFFVDDGRELENRLRGLTILSSAFGSTCCESGICTVFGTFQRPEPACHAFVPRSAAGDAKPGRCVTTT